MLHLEKKGREQDPISLIKEKEKKACCPCEKAERDSSMEKACLYAPWQAGSAGLETDNLSPPIVQTSQPVRQLSLSTRTGGRQGQEGSTTHSYTPHRRKATLPCIYCGRKRPMLPGLPCLSPVLSVWEEGGRQKPDKRGQEGTQPASYLFFLKFSFPFVVPLPFAPYQMCSDLAVVWDPRRRNMPCLDF